MLAGNQYKTGWEYDKLGTETMAEQQKHTPPATGSSSPAPEVAAAEDSESDPEVPLRVAGREWARTPSNKRKRSDEDDPDGINFSFSSNKRFVTAPESESESESESGSGSD